MPETIQEGGHVVAATPAPAGAAEGRPPLSLLQLLLEYASRDPRVCYVGVDTMIPEFQQRFPERAFDVGIAEQDQLGVATGLAHAGMIPVVQAVAPFTPLRNFEQLRTSLARHRANVKIVAAALGLINNSHGATHHDMESLALYRVVPNLVVLSTYGAGQFERAFRLAMAHDGPVVLLSPAGNYAPGREGREPLPIPADRPIEVGRSEWLLEGEDVALLTFGPALVYSYRAAERLRKAGIKAGVLHMTSLKPLDVAAITAAAGHYRALLSVEEQSIYGGLGSAVAEVLAEHGGAVRFRRLGIPDVFVEDVGDYTEMRATVGLTVDGVEAAVRHLLAGA